MITCHREPTLTETLSDPLIQAVMAADGVQPTVPAQLVDATQALNFLAGVSNSKVLRGRSLS
jgi:hypothetical protein